MSQAVLAIFPLTEQGAKDFLELLASPDGLVKTRDFEGFQDIKVFMMEDNKTMVMHQVWDSKEAHQEYVGWRMETGLGDFFAEALEGEYKVEYLTAQNV